MSVNVSSPAFCTAPEMHAATVLVVEDEVLIRMAIAAYLQECGFKVLEAGNGADAIQILRVSGMPIHLVFTDVAMPGETDGIGLMRWIEENRPTTQVAITSGDEARQPKVREAIDGHPFFPKPYDVGQVATRIRHMIAEHEAGVMPAAYAGA